MKFPLIQKAMYNSQENCWQVVRIVLPTWKNEQCKSGNEKDSDHKINPLAY